MPGLNDTHDLLLRSWVETANAVDCDFPIQNLPHGVFRRSGSGEPFRGGVAIGDMIVDLAALLGSGVVSGSASDVLQAAANPELNPLMALGPSAWSALRQALSTVLRSGSASQARVRDCLVPQAAAEHAVPARVGDFTDFFSSIHHATSTGKLSRPDQPLTPNYRWVPIAYHGRSSSIGVSGQGVRRPYGQTAAGHDAQPSFGPSRLLDYELELGAFVGPGNALGQPIALDDCDAHLFGMCLLNDWSARDLQGWEMQPLGPFLSKSFATTISPWIVTLEALEPFRTAWTRSEQEPPPLPYLDSERNRSRGGFDIQLEVWLSSAQQRAAGQAPQRLSHTSFRHQYWTVAQLLAHHTSNGCNLRPGDLLGSGTISGPTPAEAGCLLELCVAHQRRIALPTGEARLFLEDGDEVSLRGYCERPGAARIGFGAASGVVLPAAGR